MTGLRTPTEYFTETTKYDRMLISESIREWQEESQGGSGLG